MVFSNFCVDTGHKLQYQDNQDVSRQLVNIINISHILQYIPVQGEQTSDPAVARKARPSSVSRQHSSTDVSLATTRPPHLKVS